tara:strand:+ start:2854 stop:3072 length:219 start_codon:yes stop_codon:yes gene_type:complete
MFAHAGDAVKKIFCSACCVPGDEKKHEKTGLSGSGERCMDLCPARQLTETRRKLGLLRGVFPHAGRAGIPNL